MSTHLAHASDCSANLLNSSSRQLHTPCSVPILQVPRQVLHLTETERGVGRGGGEAMRLSRRLIQSMALPAAHRRAVRTGSTVHRNLSA